MCKTLKILNLSCLAFCALFSFLQIPTAVDLSFSAIWFALVFTAVLGYFAFYTLQLKSNPRFYKVANKLYEYVPYFYLIVFVLRRSGKNSTSFAYDIICVIVWIIVSVLSFVVSRYFLSDKYFYNKNTGFKKPVVHKKTLGKKAAKEGLEWIDAFVQAVFAIILLNIFIFQLYVIPSESMVDEFLVGDRVLVFKISSGPKFPMTKVGLKDFKKYERGDITVFHNPQYPDTKQKELKNFYSQIVFMLTLTKVNLNTDEFGNPMADPLVKRVCAVGGEQLVMLDGVLYRRTKDHPDFEPVKEDSKWSNWNLNELPGATKARVKFIPFTQNQYESLLETENDRRNFDINSFASEAQLLSNRFSRIASQSTAQKSQKLRSDDVKKLLSDEQRDVYNLFSDNESVVNLLLSSPYASAWFDAFMTDWISSTPSSVLNGKELYGGDMYSDSLFRMNLMIKQCFAKLIIANSKAILSGNRDALWAMSAARKSLYSQIDKLTLYMALNDSRNMMVFPPNAEDGNPTYIPEGSYFMMGDNRFNSLDMRHTYKSYRTSLMDSDDYSVTYSSMLEPKYVSHTQMLGSPCFRIFPFNRMGPVHSMRAKN